MMRSGDVYLTIRYVSRMAWMFITKTTFDGRKMHQFLDELMDENKYWNAGRKERRER